MGNSPGGTGREAYRKGYMFADLMSRLSCRRIRVIIGRRNTDCSY
jgi:hypothetical protein